MNWTDGLSKLNLSSNRYSQYGEEVIIKEIFRNVSEVSRYYVDIGSGGAGAGLSNTRLLKEKGWTGLAFDMDGSEGSIKEFVKPGNILKLLYKNECPREFDFLSVDIDSFDFDVIDQLLSQYKPRVICAEFNGTLDPISIVKLEYEDGYTWDKTNKYGFSFMAGVVMLKYHGYTVILNHKDTNIFAVDSTLLPNDHVFNVTAKQNIYHPINPNAKFVKAWR